MCAGVAVPAGIAASRVVIRRARQSGAKKVLM